MAIPSPTSFTDTTRPKKPGEEEGKEYHFVSHDTMSSLISAGKMIEFGEYKGHLYGTSSDSVSYTGSSLLKAKELFLIGKPSTSLSCNTLVFEEAEWFSPSFLRLFCNAMGGTRVFVFLSFYD